MPTVTVITVSITIAAPAERVLDNLDELAGGFAELRACVARTADACGAAEPSIDCDVAEDVGRGDHQAQAAAPGDLLAALTGPARGPTLTGMEKPFAIYMPGRTLRLVIKSWAPRRSGSSMRHVTGTWERLDGTAALGEPRWSACGEVTTDRHGHGHGPPPVGAVILSLLAKHGCTPNNTYTQESLEAGARIVQDHLDVMDFQAAFA